MLTAVTVISANEVLIEFDNRGPFYISTDNGYAQHLMEHLLSPKFNMTYSEWLEIVATADEITIAAA